jgi:cytochrome P450
MIENEERLTEQVRKARQAQQAYDTYLREYIETRRNNILSQFINGMNNPETLAHLKHCSDALLALEASILTDIESGKLSSMDLNANRGIN